MSKLKEEVKIELEKDQEYQSLKREYERAGQIRNALFDDLREDSPDWLSEMIAHHTDLEWKAWEKMLRKEDQVTEWVMKARIDKLDELKAFYGNYSNLYKLN